MKVTSFTIDHDRLLRGIYVSRKDMVGEETITTFDIRIKRPNIEPAMDMAALHTIEHLMAVYMRSLNEQWSDKIIYVGPMGCRTGMYVILKGNLEPEDIVGFVTETFKYMMNFDEDVPANTKMECGNYLDHNLDYAKYECEKYYNEVLKEISSENMVYPE